LTNYRVLLVEDDPADARLVPILVLTGLADQQMALAAIKMALKTTWSK
jgi:hypothetical protein